MEETIRRRRKKIGKLLFLIGTGFIVVHSYAVFHDWYRVLPWVDVPIHFWGGATGALLLYWLIYRFPGHVNLGKSFVANLLIVLSWSALGGVVWEFTEFIYDSVIGEYGFNMLPVQFGLEDTLADLAFDLAGGLVVAIAMQVVYYKKKRLT